MLSRINIKMHPTAGNGGLKNSNFKGSFELNKRNLLSMLTSRNKFVGLYVLNKAANKLIFAFIPEKEGEILGHDDLVYQWFEDPHVKDFDVDNYSCGTLGVQRTGNQLHIRIHFASGLKELVCTKNDFEAFKEHFIEMLSSLKLDMKISFLPEATEDHSPLFMLINIKLPS